MRRRGRPPYPDILTPREWEVLALLRARHTNDQIAAQLGITAAGAKYHVSEILSKLAVSGREQAAAWRPDPEPVLQPLRRLWANSMRGLLPLKALGATVVVAAGVALIALAFAVASTRDGVISDQVAAEPSPTDPPTPAPSISPLPTPSSVEEALLDRRPVEHSAIYIADRDGAQERRVTTGFSPVWSPNGQRIAYVGATTGPGLTGIDWVHDMNADGSDSVEIGGYDWDQGSPTTCAPYGLGSWAPDSDTFAIWTGPGELHQSEIVDVETGQAEPFGGCYSQWFSDGRLLFHTPCGPGNARTCINILERDGVILPVTTGHLGSPSPTGKWLAIGRDSDLWIRDMETGEEVLLANINTAAPGLPDWSPDGLKIVVAADQVYVISLENGTIRGLGQGMFPKWSPDGTRIAFYDRETDTVCGSRLRVVDAVSTHEIFSAPAVGYVFDWSPDGSQIAYSRNTDVPPGCNKSIVRSSTPTASTPPTPTPAPAPAPEPTPTGSPTPRPAEEVIVYGERISWEEAQAFVLNCGVLHVGQTNTLFVTLLLKNSRQFHTYEPVIDAILHTIWDAEPTCGAVGYVTE